MIAIESAPAFATIQDRGRTGWRAQGMPVGGALDPWALHLANALVGNRPDAAAIEWMLNGGRVKFVRPAPFALAGAEVSARLGSRIVKSRQLYFASEGDVLQIDEIRDGRIVYLAGGGGINVPPILGSRATYLPAGFGGLEGRRLRTGDRLSLGKRRWPPPRFESAWMAGCPWLKPQPALRFIPGGQWSTIPEDYLAALARMHMTVAVESDRLGLRLETRLPAPPISFSAPSEPVMPGTIEITPDGRLLVLLADGPTVGGYPKLGVLPSVDLSRLVQMKPGALFQFATTTVQEAQIEHRQAVAWLARLRSRVSGQPTAPDSL